MSIETTSTSGANAAVPASGSPGFAVALSRHAWRVLAPRIEGPVRGRTREAMRRVIETRLDARRLHERLPELAQHSQARERLWATLLPVYRRFVARVAPPAAATSMEVAGFLTDLCSQRRPCRVLELGTGFASAVLRRLAEPPAWTPEIWSVDDDPARLVRTRAFLAEESLSTERLLSWHEFRATRESAFELFVHELVSTPSAPLVTILDRVASGGLLLLDGAHRPAAGREARQLLTDAGAEHWSLRAVTRDCFGRYALLAQR